MRSLLVVSAVLSANACLFVLACSDESPKDTSTDDGGASSSSGSSGKFPDLPDSGSTSGTSGAPRPPCTVRPPVADAGQQFADNGCLLHSTPMKAAKKIENVPTAGGIPWTKVDSAQIED